MTAAPTPFAAFPDPWEDRAALAAAAADCRAAVDRLLPRLAAALEERHRVDLGPRYWRIVLGPWLLYHVQQVEDRRRRAALALAAGTPLVLLDEADFRTPRDGPDFLSMCPTESYALQVLALCVRAAGASAPTARAAESARFVPRPVGRLDALKAAAKTVGYAAARALRPPRVLTDGVYPLGRRRHAELDRACGGGVWPLAAPLPERLRVPAVLDEARLSLSRLLAEGPLEAAVVATLPRCLPALFLEGFAGARARAVRLLGRPPAVMLHSSGVYYDEMYKLCAAEAARAGARLVGVQHGGQYGTALWSNPEWHERAIADSYLTWGWTEDAKTAPVPVPWLGDAPPRAPEPGRLLLLSTSGLAIPHELFPAPMSAQYRAFFGWRERFLAALDAASLAASAVRPFPVDCGWGERAALAARFPGLRLDSGPFRDSVSKAALVVCDHPGTMFFETLAWDVPGVHFWEDRLWPSRPAAAAALEPLRRAGIVHDSPESAARQAAKVRGDAAAWWASRETRAARAGFVERYARTSPDWARRWAQTVAAAGARPV